MGLFTKHWNVGNDAKLKTKQINNLQQRVLAKILVLLLLFYGLTYWCVAYIHIIVKIFIYLLVLYFLLEKFLKLLKFRSFTKTFLEIFVCFSKQLFPSFMSLEKVKSRWRERKTKPDRLELMHQTSCLCW